MTRRSNAKPISGRSSELHGSSRLFLDTADVAEYSVHLPLGIFYGVTSNPTLLENAGVEPSLLFFFITLEPTVE